MNDDGDCDRCAARQDAYREGMRQAALASLYTAADNLIAGGWDLETICRALHERPDCAALDEIDPPGTLRVHPGMGRRDERTR